MVNLILGILRSKGIITYAEAEVLGKELQSGIIPAEFKLAMAQIQSIFDSYEAKEAKINAKNALANNKKL